MDGVPGLIHHTRQLLEEGLEKLDAVQHIGCGHNLADAMHRPLRRANINGLHTRKASKKGAYASYDEAHISTMGLQSGTSMAQLTNGASTSAVSLDCEFLDGHSSPTAKLTENLSGDGVGGVLLIHLC